MELLKIQNDYLDYVKLFKSEGTYLCYSHHLNIIIKWFIKNKFIVNKKNLLKYIEYCKTNQLSNKTINHRILCIKCAFKFSNIESDIYDFKKMRTLDNRFSNLKKEEEIKFKNYVNNSTVSISNKLVLALFYDTGIRLRELTKIEIKNIDFEKRSIYLTETKNKKNRYVFYTSFSEQFLKLLELKDKRYLFNYSPRGIYNIFVKAKEELLFEKFHPHMLRHTFATNLLMNGSDIETVRMLMGHNSIVQTQKYIHLNLDYIKINYDKVMNQINLNLLI